MKTLVYFFMFQVFLNMLHWPQLPTMPAPMMTMGPRAPQSTMRMAMTLLVTLSHWSARRHKARRLHTFLEAKGAQRSPWQPPISLDRHKSQRALLGPYTHHHHSPLQPDQLPSSDLQVSLMVTAVCLHFTLCFFSRLSN